MNEKALRDLIAALERVVEKLETVGDILERIERNTKPVEGKLRK